MSTHNICFYAEIRKNIPEISPDTPPLQFLCSQSYSKCSMLKILPRVLSLKDISTFGCHFVSSQCDREKWNRGASRWEKQKIVREKTNASTDTEEMLPCHDDAPFLHLLQVQHTMDKACCDSSSENDLTLSMLCKNFIRQQFKIFFLLFQENGFWHFRQIVSYGNNFHEMSNPVSWKKIRKI